MDEVVKSFDHNGKKYEIRLSCTTDGLAVRAYCGGKPANGFQYGISQMNESDLRRHLGFAAIQYFAKSAEDDVIEGRWEKYLNAVKEVNEADRRRAESE